MNRQTKNLIIEKAGINLVRKDYPNLVVPTSEEKKVLLEKIGCTNKFLKSFDAIMLKVPTIGDIKTTLDFTFVEFKTSGLELPQWPKGYWTGLTENERALATVFGDNFKFCFVNTHPNTSQYLFWTINELDANCRGKSMCEHIRF